MTQLRGARREEYGELSGLMERSFGPDERHLWEYIAANDPALEPECCRIAAADGRILASTVALPRRIRTRWGWTPGAVITLVACDPDYQRRGYGGATVRDALDLCRRRGWRIAVLYGIPAFYPRYGFVPVLPRLETELGAPPGGVAGPGNAAAGAGGLAWSTATVDDLPAIQAIYAETLGRYPMAVDRDVAGWVWQYRQDAAWEAIVRRALAAGLPGNLEQDQYWRYRLEHPSRLMVWRGPAAANGGILGYARLEPQARDVLVVPEAAVRREVDAPALLAALVEAAKAHGRPKLRLTLPPGEPLVRAARLAGANQQYRAPRAGMAAVVDWEGWLPSEYEIRGLSVAGDETGTLVREGRPVLRAGRTLLAGLVLGYLSAADLAIAPSVEWRSGKPEQLEKDFGPQFPQWTLAPYW